MGFSISDLAERGDAMQCALTIEPLDDQSQPYREGPLDGSHIISSITEHPDITDAWEAFAALLAGIAATIAAGLAGAGVTAGAVLGATATWVSNEVRSGMDKKYGDVKRISLPAGAAYWLPNTSAPIVDWGSQLRVKFRAWSEDEIKPGAEKHVEQPAGGNAGIVDEGGGYHQSDGTYYWDWSFRIPLRTLPVGVYTISFVAADDGWFFDVGVTKVFVVEVDQNPYPRQVGTPVTFVPPSALDLAALQGALRAVGQVAHLRPNARSVSPKHTSKRTDGRAPVPVDVAMAISFTEQKPAPTPKDRAPTVLPMEL
jgi:hypothetical protein